MVEQKSSILKLFEFVTLLEYENYVYTFWYTGNKFIWIIIYKYWTMIEKCNHTHIDLIWTIISFKKQNSMKMTINKMNQGMYAEWIIELDSALHFILRWTF